jgi:hypothetical protein
MEPSDLFAVPIALLCGFIATVYGFRHVMTWLFYSWSQLNPEHGKRSIVAFLVAFFLSPGLWVLLAFVLASSYFSSSWWAPWALGGVIAGAIYLVGVAVFVIRKSKKASNERAA